MPSTREDRRAGFYLFVQDWLSEETLKGCGYAEKGLWIDMLCLMARSPRKGILLRPNGMPGDSKWLANQLGRPEEVVRPLLERLGAELVYSVTPDTKAIYSRKMKADADLLQKRSDAGKKGADARWNADGKGMANENGKGMATGGKDRIGVVVVTRDFSCFWKAYPSRVGKKAALKAWDRAKDRPPIEVILAAIEAQKKGRKWKEGYVPNPATWLNQGRWADEPEEKVGEPGGTYDEGVDLSPETLERKARGEG